MNIQKTVITRLASVWLIISVFSAAFVYWFETERIDEKVKLLAVEAEKELPRDLLIAYNNGEGSLREMSVVVKNMSKEHFAIIELYDRRGKKIIEEVQPHREELEAALSLRGHGLPHNQDIQYEKIWIKDEFLLQVIIPIKNDRQIEGYFEGVYIVGKDTEQQIKGDVLVSVLLAMLVIFVTTLVLYPVIISLNRRVIEQSKSLLHANIELLEVLGSAIAKRDSDTNIHNYRVTLYAIALAETVGLSSKEIIRLITGAFLHDVGKIAISDNILLKPARLTSEEFEIMKTHVDEGMDIINTSSWLGQAGDVVACHHEKFDGSGYMQGLSGESIPLNARIFAIVDVFDALTSRRPYKEPMPYEDSMAIIEKDAGSHFDPQLVKKFAKIAGGLYQTFSNMNEDDIIRLLKDKTEKYFFE